MSCALLADAVAHAAEGWIGTPYRHQASVKGQGTDCLGLVRGVWREVVGNEPEVIPPYTPHWDGRGQESLLAAAVRNLRRMEEDTPRRGKVLLFRMIPSGPAKHCGIALSPQLFIHAYDGRAVCRARYSRWWSARLAGMFDFPSWEDDTE